MVLLVKHPYFLDGFSNWLGRPPCLLSWAEHVITSHIHVHWHL